MRYEVVTTLVGTNEKDLLNLVWYAQNEELLYAVYKDTFSDTFFITVSCLGSGDVERLKQAFPEVEFDFRQF